MKSTCIIIQARFSSTRLPGKVMEDIGGRPMISRIIRRAKASKYGNNVCLATTTGKEDDTVAEVGRSEKVHVFRGDRDDVLSRYYLSAREIGAENIIRITGDCPFTDPEIIDKVAEFYLDKKVDYASNIQPPTFPDGLDVEVFSMPAIEKSFKEANKKYQREHVTPYIYENGAIFKMANYVNSVNLYHMRWIVDRKQDLTFAREIYRRIFPKKGEAFHMADILKVLEKEPDLQKLNAGIDRYEGFKISLKKEGLL